MSFIGHVFNKALNKNIPVYLTTAGPVVFESSYESRRKQEHWVGLRLQLFSYSIDLGAAIRRYHRGTLLGKDPRRYVKAVVCGAWHQGDDPQHHATVEFYAGDDERHPTTGHVLRGPRRPPGPALRRDWAPWLLPAPAVAVAATTGPVVCVGGDRDPVIVVVGR
ncbi:MAG: hypothetical protein M1826_000509 [Phylliscum demangeonii]|nr:MAG: hypothetical protein M1826_000509 [Phylliscum demangeonii]